MPEMSKGKRASLINLGVKFTNAALEGGHLILVKEGPGYKPCLKSDSTHATYLRLKAEFIGGGVNEDLASVLTRDSLAETVARKLQNTAPGKAQRISGAPRIMVTNLGVYPAPAPKAAK